MEQMVLKVKAAPNGELAGEGGGGTNNDSEAFGGNGGDGGSPVKQQMLAKMVLVEKDQVVKVRKEVEQWCCNKKNKQSIQVNYMIQQIH